MPEDTGSIDDAIAALEASQQKLQETSSETIAANLEQLAALQKRLEEDRARLAKQQRRTRGGINPTLNVADVEQQRVMEGEVNELRRRRDTAREANVQAERALAKTLEDCERFQFILDTPAGTPFPPKSAAAMRTPRLTPSQRLEAGLRNLGGSMKAGLPPPPRPRRAQTRQRPSTMGGLQETGAAIADRLENQRLEMELQKAENKLASATLRRDTYEHMAQRLRLEKQSFDPRFNAAYAELQRERKRVAQLRVAASAATQELSNAEQTRRSTERKVASRQKAEKALLAEQQATLLSTQQSVLHFEVSRMSRSQSAIRLDQMPPTGSATGASAALAAERPSFL